MNQVVLSLRVKPGASRSEVVGWPGDVLEIRIAAPPREGRANAALLEFLADALAVPLGSLTLVRGHRGRHKQVAVQGLGQDEVWRRLGL